MPKVISFANQKGGCGKTTSLINVAGGLTVAKYRVLVVDADPQASATIWSLSQGQGSLPFNVLTATQLGGRFGAVREQDCDFVLVDTPAGMADSQDAATRFARAAIAGSDAVIVPLRPSVLDFAAARIFVRYLIQVKPAHVQAALLLNSMDHTVLSRRAPEVAQDLFASVANGTVFQTTIGRRAAITEVSGSGKTIFQYRPSHEAAKEYANLTREIVQWLLNAQI